ncbi:unnamed protein product, partial [marine sediment metagenome]
MLQFFRSNYQVEDAMSKEDFLRRLLDLSWEEKKILHVSCTASVQEALTGNRTSEDEIAASLNMDYFTYDERLHEILNKLGVYSD